MTGRTLPGDFHINRIKRVKEVMPDGIATTYEQLHSQIGLPIATCTQQPINSAAQLQIKQGSHMALCRALFGSS